MKVKTITTRKSNPNGVKTAAANAQDLKIVTKGAGIGLFGRLATIVFTVGFQFILARTLGSADLGIVSIALSIIGTATVIAEFGLSQGVVRFVAHYIGSRDWNRAAGAVHSGVRIVLVTSLTIAVVLYAVTPTLATEIFQKPELTNVLRILALGLPFAALTSVGVSIAQGLKRIEYRAIIQQTVVPLLKIGGVAVAFFVGISLTSVSYALLFAFVIGGVLSAVSIWHLYPLRTRQGKPVLITRSMMTFSVPLLLTTVLSRTWQETETIILGAYTTSDQVGIYFVALKVNVVLTLFLSGFSAIFSPMIAELHGQNETERLERLFKTVTKWGFTFALPVFVLLVTFSEEVMGVFGADFVAGAPLLRVLAVAQLFNVSVGAVGVFLIMTGYPRLNLLNSLLAFGLSLVLDFTLIPTYGVYGAAIAGGTALLFANALNLVEVYITSGMHPYERGFLKPIVASGLAGIVIALLHWFLPLELPVMGRFILLAAIMFVTYWIILRMLGFDQDDKMLMSFLQKRVRRLSR